MPSPSPEDWRSHHLWPVSTSSNAKPKAPSKGRRSMWSRRQDLYSPSPEETEPGFGNLLQRLARCHEENCSEKEELRRQVSSLSGEVMLLRSALRKEVVRIQHDGTVVEDPQILSEEKAGSGGGTADGADPDASKSLQGRVVKVSQLADDDVDDGASETSGAEDPTERWGTLTSNLLYGTGCSCFYTNHHAPYELLLHWSLLRESRDTGCATNAAGLRMVHMLQSSSFPPKSRDHASEWVTPVSESCLQDFVASPTSKRRLLWCMIGVLMLTWDALIIPMQVFPLGDFGEAVRVVTMATSAYWLIDMPFQCFIAFQYADGSEEKRPSAITKNYLKTWFLLDLLVLLIDGGLFALDRFLQDMEGTTSEGSFLQAGRSLRLARLVRLLRLVRLFRLRKLNEFFAVALFRIKSEHVILGIKLAKHVGRILVINHYIACAWYALAYFNTSTPTWLAQYAGEDHSTIHVYIMSLHWSMTQFSPATNNIAPQNWFERIFAVFVVLFALISFSSFISSVTNTVNQLRTLNLEPQMEEVKIREFLFARKVSPELVGRILNFFKQNYHGRQKRVHEQDITFFQDVPESMKIRLHEEAYMPLLQASPMFAEFADFGRPILIQVCHTAFVEEFYLPQQDVFVDGMPSAGVYYVNAGRLLYTSMHTQEIQEFQVAPEDWISEMCLWVRWDHCGQLVAETSCEITKLDKAKFNTIVCKAGGPFVECLRRFAVFVLGHIEALDADEAVTDVSLGGETLRQLAIRARRLWELQNQSRNRGGGAEGRNGFHSNVHGLLQ